MSHQAWSTEEGLPQASVHQILQTRDGYLWLATEGGVVRFDGISFKVFSHEQSPVFTSDDVTSLAQDGWGDLWIGTSDGLIEDSGTTFRRFGEPEGLPSAGVVSLQRARDGSLLVLTGAGLVRHERGRFRRIDGAPSFVSGMDMSAGGDVWLFAGEEAFREEASGVARFPLPVAASAPLLGVQRSADGAIWVRTAREVMLEGAGEAHRWTVSKELEGTRIETMFVDRAGTTWIGTNRGLFTLTAGSKARPKSVEELRGNSILCVYEDREGNIWIGTEASGLHVLRPRKFTSERALAGDAITAVVETSDGVLWAGTRNDGLLRVQHGRADVPVPASALTSPVVLSLAAGRQGDLWVGTPDGLSHVQNGTVRRYTSADGLPDDFARSLLVDGDGSVWVGTRFGLTHLMSDKMKTLTTADGLESDSIGSLFQMGGSGTLKGTNGSGTLWIGTTGGLSRTDGRGIQTFSSREGLAGKIVTAVTEDRNGTVWVGVHGAGLSSFRDGRFRQVASADLPMEILALTVDGTGYLWLRAQHGVFRVSVAELAGCMGASNRCALHVSHYGVADGMPSDELTSEGSPVLWQSDGGELLLTTRKGLAVADPLHLPVDRVPPPVVLQRFLVDDVEQTTVREARRIPAGHHSYTFDYAGLSYTMPARVRYRYMLEGFDRSWNDAGNRRTAYYTSLPPRRYRFRVVAANADGVWNETGAEVSFVVLPPFYRRWWFYCLVAMLAVGLAMVIVRLRVEQERRQFALVLNERSRVAREIHDTLAQDFVSISLQLEIASKLVNGQQFAQAAQQLQQTRSLVKDGLEAARQSIWNLRANVTQTSLPTRVSGLGQQFAAKHGGTQIRIGGAYRPLRAEIEDEVYRIAQEALSNVERHAGAESVHVEVRYERDQLLLTVRDNGRGFSDAPERELHGHYGLHGMQERARNINAKLVVSSAAGQGTMVSLAVPLTAKEELNA